METTRAGTETTINSSDIRLFLGLSISFFGPNKAGSAAVPLNLYKMKKLIVTCTAVAYAIAFIGCGGADPESLPEGENPIGDEPGAAEGDLEGDTDPVAGPGGGDSEE